MNRGTISLFKPLTIISRSKGYKHSGGIRYPGGITYFPRDPNYVEPDVTPSKLFRVELIKSTKHYPYWQKDILESLKLNSINQVAIVKNVPEMNAILWKVKHLIKITPITFPYGEPTEEDIEHTVLKENGECIVTKTLKPDESKVKALEQFEKNPKKMDSTTIKRDSRLKWNNAYSGGY
ncbi:39S ribosomal protein L30, mitochondrial [Colias croceus]|uniref:39S ribosomal protein L30, mitochondrial n=1 Tax=Colias crocea TaxID=72248 RepID=UPI001E27A332|nr:39S ribosomal protein L30, mitochondrial [Colias croceus]